MRSIRKKFSILFILIACTTLCLLLLSGCEGLIKEENGKLQTAAEGNKTSDAATLDACSKAVKELTQKPYYHLVLKSENDSIQTQIYCDGENYLVSDYDGELRLASVIKYGGVYAVEEEGKYSITREYEVAYADYIIQTYDILGKTNLEIEKIEYESDRVISIHAEWDETDDGLVAHIQGNFVYEFSDNGVLSSVLVEETWHIDELPAERYYYSLVNPRDTHETITNAIYKAAQQIANPNVIGSEPKHDDLIVPPSNNTEYDTNFSLGSDEMKWHFFDDSWSFALRGEDQTSEGIMLVHKPASETKDVILEHGQEFFLESWDGTRWNLLFTGNISSETAEANLVFSGDTIIDPVHIQLNWGAQYGILAEGKYRVGMYYMATSTSGEQESKLCYAKFLVNKQENDSLINKCNSALEEILKSDSYHIQRINYMSEQKHKQDSYYYVQDIWKSKQNYYSEVIYYYNSSGEPKNALGMLLRDGVGYSWNTLQSPDKLWSENDDLMENNFQTWVIGMDCTVNTLERVIKEGNSITFEFPRASAFSVHDKIQKKVITYYFNPNDELVSVTLEYIGDNQEKMMEAELLVKTISSESAENVIREQNVTEVLVN